MRFRVTIAVFSVLGWVSAPAQVGHVPAAAHTAAAADSSSKPAKLYDPKRDAAADIQTALREAQKTGKRVLVDVGGNWVPCAMFYSVCSIIIPTW